MNKAQAMQNTTQKTHGAVIYTRVSTGEQDKHGTSPETQLAACRAKALALGLPIVAEYYDGGVSGGFLLARPGMQAALTDLQTGRADTLICANMTRYSRDVEHQQAIKKAVQSGGGRLVFCDIDFEDTPEGDMMFTFMGGYAQYERQVIRKRTSEGRTQKAKNGLQPSRRTSPYGYHIPTKADVMRGEYPLEALGRYLVVETEAAVVRRIFAAYHGREHSLAGLARELTQQGIPTPGRATAWSMTTIHYILSNPVYKGLAVYGRFDNHMDEGRLAEKNWRTGEPLKEPRFRTKADPKTWITMDCPPLVTEEVWDAVQTRFQENKAQRSGNPVRVRMLAGRIHCPYCGQGLGAGSTKTRSRYGETKGQIKTVPQRFTCTLYMDSIRRKGQAECQPTGYLVEEVEQDVIAAILDAATSSEAIAAAAASAYAEALPGGTASAAEDARREMVSLDRMLAGLAQEEAATVQAQIQGIMQGAPADAYAAAFADLAARRKDLEDRRGSLSRSLKNRVKNTVKNRMEKARPAGNKAGAAPGMDTAKRQALENVGQALEDVARVLLSPDVPGQVKRDAVGCLVENVVPSRETGELVTSVYFRAGVLFSEETLSENEHETLNETLQTMRLGSLKTRALFSRISALSWAANGRMRLNVPPPAGSEDKPPPTCPNKIGCD